METNFEIPSDVLDEIQNNIQNIIESFDIPSDNKMDIIKKINFVYSQTKQMSFTDALTGLFNRRHFEVEFDREYKRARRYKSDLSLAIIDIDFFKKVNDTYGHLCGDYVLKEIAFLIKQNFRQTDILFRYGGEEFAVILTETPYSTASIPLERLRKKIENHHFSFGGNDFKITISAGISSNTEFENAFEMFDEADKVLYDVKNNGRNSVKQAIDSLKL